jgi:hypothetical protein
MRKKSKQLEKFNLNDFISEIQHLQEAKELLEQVFLEVGPYGDGKISRELRSKINDYVKFDDSE